MATSKIPYSKKIPLEPFNGDNFFAIVIESNNHGRPINELWIFREGCEVALFQSSSFVRNDDSTMTYDGIRALDARGEFDMSKEELCEMR